MTCVRNNLVCVRVLEFLVWKFGHHASFGMVHGFLKAIGRFSFCVSFIYWVFGIEYVQSVL